MVSHGARLPAPAHPLGGPRAYGVTTRRGRAACADADTSFPIVDGRERVDAGPGRTRQATDGYDGWDS